MYEQRVNVQTQAAVKQQKLEQRVAEAQVVHRSCSLPWLSGVPHSWRRQSHAQPKRNGGKRRGRGEECRSRGSWASQAVRSNPLSNECTLARGARSHTDTRSPVRFPGQVSIGTQASLSQEAAAAANHQQQQRQQLEERAQERGARDAVVPLLARAVASAEAAQRAASQQLEAMRPTAERSALEAAAAAADREAAMEQRGQLAAVQSELRSLKVAASLV